MLHSGVFLSIRGVFKLTSLFVTHMNHKNNCSSRSARSVVTSGYTSSLNDVVNVSSDWVYFGNNLWT